MKNTLNQLNKAYSKRLNQLNRNMTDIAATYGGATVFIEYLKYLRDSYIITQRPTSIIASLNAAIEEFEAFTKTNQEFHWNNFCEFIKLNMKEWLIANDSI